MARKITSEYGQAVFNLPWLVAQEEGLFAEEGLEVEFVRGRERDPHLAAETDPRQVHPFWRHAPFEERAAQVFNACEWGQIRRSDESRVNGQIVSMRPAVVSQGIFVRPDSPITHPQDLRNKTVAVNFHAGSHYLTLQMLEGFMDREEIKVVHLGQARVRYRAMIDGEVEAAALMEPYIALAEKTGCKLIIEAHYAGSEMAAPDIDPATFEAINRALRMAVRLVNADKRKYLHHIIADLPPDLGPLSAEDFRLSRLRYVEPRPYPSEEFEKTRAWMVSWGLASAEASFEDLVDNRIAVSG
jgi:NitT/TauT family transport system substrate-binding protein